VQQASQRLLSRPGDDEVLAQFAMTVSTARSLSARSSTRRMLTLSSRLWVAELVSRLLHVQ